MQCCKQPNWVLNVPFDIWIWKTLNLIFYQWLVMFSRWHACCLEPSYSDASQSFTSIVLCVQVRMKWVRCLDAWKWIVSCPSPVRRKKITVLEYFIRRRDGGTLAFIFCLEYSELGGEGLSCFVIVLVFVQSVDTWVEDNHKSLFF